MDKMISINYPGGAHGHFLELLCNTMYTDNTIDVTKVVNSNGAYHSYDQGNTKIAVSAPFWWHLQETTGNAYFNKLLLPPLSLNIVNITAESIMEKALCRTYWRRRGDCFFMSAQELLLTTRSELLSLNSQISIINKNSIDTRILGIINSVKSLIFENVLSQFKEDNSNISEMNLIRFWTNPHLYTSHADYDYLVNASNRWIDLVNSEKIVSVKMIDLYDTSTALQMLHSIGINFGLGPPQNLETTATLLANFKSNLSEIPNLDLVQSKFNDIVGDVDSSLSDMTLNDKIVLFNMILIKYRLMAFHFDHIDLYPESTFAFKKILVKLAKFKRPNSFVYE